MLSPEVDRARTLLAASVAALEKLRNAGFDEDELRAATRRVVSLTDRLERVRDAQLADASAADAAGWRKAPLPGPLSLRDDRGAEI